MVELEPNDLSNRLALAKAAFICKDFARARKALSGADEASRKTAAYQELTGLLALAANQPEESAAYLAEAARHYDGTDLYNYTSPNGGSLRKAIAGLVSLAYPIERTGVGLHRAKDGTPLCSKLMLALRGGSCETAAAQR